MLLRPSCSADLLHDVVHQLQALDWRGGSMAQLLPLDSDVPDQVSIPPLPGLACLSPEVGRLSAFRTSLPRAGPNNIGEYSEVLAQTMRGPTSLGSEGQQKWRWAS